MLDKYSVSFCKAMSNWVLIIDLERDVPLPLQFGHFDNVTQFPWQIVHFFVPLHLEHRTETNVVV